MNPDVFNQLYGGSFSNIQNCIKCGIEYDSVSVWYVGTVHEKYLIGLCDKCAKEQ